MSAPTTDPVRPRSDVASLLLEALDDIRVCDSFEGKLDRACQAVVEVGDFDAAVLTFYLRDMVGYGAAGDLPEDIKDRFRSGYLRGSSEGRRQRRRRLWRLRRPGTNVVFLPAGEGPEPSSVFVPSPESGGTWRSADRLMVLCPGLGGVSFGDDLFAVLSLDRPSAGNRPDEAVWERLVVVQRFLAQVAVQLENDKLREHLELTQRHNRQILAALPSSVALLDRTGRVLMASPGAGRGAVPELVAGGSLLDLPWPVDVHEALEALLDSGLPIPPTEVRLDLMVGERDILLRGAPTSREISPLDEAAAVAVVAVEDVTELREMQAHLRKTEKLHAIGRLASGVAHDFNNMLTGVIGSLSLAGMEARDDAPALRELLHDARAAAERGAVLTRQLQAFARPSEHLDLEPVDLTKIARRTVDLLERTVDQRITIEIEEEPGLPHVLGDARLLEHALIHLGTNACDALAARIRAGDREGRPLSLCIGLTYKPDCSHAPHGSVGLTVVDDGVGMDEWTLGQAFDPFFTTDESGRHPGIGLTLARSVVVRHGGTIEIASQPGAGTEVRAWIPAASSSDPERTAYAAGGGRVLVVDDDAAVLSIVCRMLEACGYDAAPVTSGEDAIGALRAAPGAFRAIVLDYSMPGLDGEQTLRRLHDDGVPLPPVLLSTGDPSRFGDGRLDALGVSGYLPKPYRPETLEAALAKVLA